MAAANIADMTLRFIGLSSCFEYAVDRTQSSNLRTILEYSRNATISTSP